MEEKQNVTCVCEKCHKVFTAPKTYDLCFDCSNVVVETRQCCQCGEDFEIKFGESNFYNKAGLKLPTRCPKCRKERKAKHKKTN